MRERERSERKRTFFFQVEAAFSKLNVALYNSRVALVLSKYSHKKRFKNKDVEVVCARVCIDRWDRGNGGVGGWGGGGKEFIFVFFCFAFLSLSLKLSNSQTIYLRPPAP